MKNTQVQKELLSSSIKRIYVNYEQNVMLTNKLNLFQWKGLFLVFSVDPNMSINSGCCWRKGLSEGRETFTYPFIPFYSFNLVFALVFCCFAPQNNHFHKSKKKNCSASPSCLTVVGKKSFPLQWEKKVRHSTQILMENLPGAQWLIFLRGHIIETHITH